MQKKLKFIFLVLLAFQLVLSGIFSFPTSYAAPKKQYYQIAGENPEMILFKLRDEDNKAPKKMIGTLYKKGYTDPEGGGYYTTSLFPLSSNDEGEMVLPENTIDKGAYYFRFHSNHELEKKYQDLPNFEFEYDPSKGDEAFKTLPPEKLKDNNDSPNSALRESFIYPAYKKGADGRDVIVNVYDYLTVEKFFSETPDGEKMDGIPVTKGSYTDLFYSRIKVRMPSTYKQYKNFRSGSLKESGFEIHLENKEVRYAFSTSNPTSGEHPITAWYKTQDGAVYPLTAGDHFTATYNTRSRKMVYKVTHQQMIEIGNLAHGLSKDNRIPNEKLLKTGYIEFSSPLKPREDLVKKEVKEGRIPVASKVAIKYTFGLTPRFYGEHDDMGTTHPNVSYDDNAGGVNREHFVLFNIKKEAAPGDPIIRLTVPEKEGSTKYLNGAVYDVYLKYLINKEGKLVDPKTFTLSSGQQNNHGVIEDLSSLTKMGSIPIFGERNDFVLSNEDYPEIKAKGFDLKQAIYTVIPVKRAPQYFLDKRPDGKYAEIEFPKMAADGSLDSSQIIEITLKGEIAQKGNKELHLFTKKDAKDNPIEGMIFTLKRIGVTKKIEHDGTIKKHKYQNVDEEIAKIESDDQGRVIVPESTYMPAGAYFITEENAEGKGYQKTFFHFTYLPDKDGKMRMNYKDSALWNNGKEDPSLKKHFSPYDQLENIESGEHLTLYNYKKFDFDYKIVGTDGSESDINTISPNESYYYKQTVRISDSYPEEQEDGVTGDNRTVFFSNASLSGEKIKLLVSEVFDTRSKVSPLVGGSDLSNEISVWYKTPDGQIHEVEQKKHFDISISKEGKVWIFLSKKNCDNIIRDIHGKEPIGKDEIGKYSEIGDLFFQIKAKIDGSLVEEADFDPSNEGFSSSMKYTYSTKKEKGYFPKFKEFDEYLTWDSSASVGDTITLSKTVRTKPIRVGLHLLKSDNEGNLLPNAEFLVYDSDDDSMEPLKPYDHASTEPYTVKSDDQGRITAEKLPYRLGGYYFKEIKAPQGYRLPKALLKMENTVPLPMVGNTGDAGQYSITLGSHTDADKILNIRKNEDIINTGTMGTIMSLLGGVSVLALGIFLKKRKKR